MVGLRIPGLNGVAPPNPLREGIANKGNELYDHRRISTHGGEPVPSREENPRAVERGMGEN
jgi:hypothetical protein